MSILPIWCKICWFIRQYLSSLCHTNFSDLSYCDRSFFAILSAMEEINIGLRHDWINFVSKRLSLVILAVMSMACCVCFCWISFVTVSKDGFFLISSNIPSSNLLPIIIRFSTPFRGSCEVISCMSTLSRNCEVRLRKKTTSHFSINALVLLVLEATASFRPGVSIMLISASSSLLT